MARRDRAAGAEVEFAHEQLFAKSDFQSARRGARKRGKSDGHGYIEDLLAQERQLMGDFGAGSFKIFCAAVVCTRRALAGCAPGPELAVDQPSALVRFSSKNSLEGAAVSHDDPSCKVSKTSGFEPIRPIGDIRSRCMSIVDEAALSASLLDHKHPAE